MRLQPCSATRTIGALVRSVRLSASPMQPRQAAELRAALLSHRVLVFSPECAAGSGEDGGLTEAELIAHFDHFGEALPQDGREEVRGDDPRIFRVTNIHPGDSPPPTSPFLTDAELEFHSDLSYRASPGIFSMLHAKILPGGAAGSITTFADT